MQQVVARMRPTGAAIDESALQNIDYGLGDAGNKEIDYKKLYDQTGDIYYRGVDAEGNRVPIPIQELQNVGFLGQMDALKKKEKGERPLLAGIPKNFPALARAQKMGEKVKKVGFDWPDASSSFAKVREEISELQEVIERISAIAPDSAGTPAKESSHIDDLKAQMTGEIGDVIFAIVNFSRHVGINAEEALQITNEKFNRRFDFVEQRVRDSGGWGLSRNLQELDGYWEEAKKRERGQTPT